MTKTLFPEIINVLEREAGQHKLATVSDDVIQEFYENNSVASQPGTAFVQPAINQTPVFNQASPNTITQAETKATAQPATIQTDNLNLSELQTATSQCRTCKLCTGRTNVVFGEGSPNADIMFIGEGPGQDEDLQGIPFVGKAGQLLTKMILAMQYQRQDVYIANIVKCRPPHNRNPEPDEVNACLPYLLQQIRLIQPKVLVLLGAVPLSAILNKKGITRLHGIWHDFQGIKTMPTFHPAYLLRYPTAKRDAWNDLQKVMALLGKTPTQQGR